MTRANESPLWWPCNTGMHQEFGSRAAPPGTIYEVQNMRLEDSGCLLKRPGLTGIAATVPSSTPQIVGDGSTYAVEKPRFVASVGDVKIVGSTNGDVFALNDTSDEFVFSGRCSTALPVRKRKGDMAFPLEYAGLQPAIAVNSSGYVLLVAMTQTGPGTARIFVETPEGARVLNHRLSGINKIQALAVGATFYVIWQVNTDIRVSAVSVTTGIGAGTSIGTLVSSSAHWDTAAYDGTNWFLVHQDGATQMRVDKMSGTASASSGTFAVTGTCPVSLFASATQAQLWIGYYNDPTVTGDVDYQVWSDALAVTLAETTLVSAADIYGPPLFGAYYDADNPTQVIACLYVYRVVNTTGNELRAMGVGVAYSDSTTATTPVLTYHCNPISKPDNYNRVWVHLCPPGVEDDALGQGRAMLLRFNQRTAGTAVFPVIELASPPTPWLGTTKGPDGAQGRFHAQARNSTRSYWAFPLCIANLADSPIVDIAVYEYTVGDQEPHADTEPLNETTVCAGGPTEAFGRFAPLSSALHEGLNEIGFAHRPTIVSAASAAGTTLAAGTYSYRAVYEWVDMNGRRHQSEPSLPVAVTLSATADIQLVVTTIHLTQRRESVQSNDIALRIYRTVAGGTTYHRTALGVSGTTAAGVSTTLTDQLSDAALADNEPLYTDGGVLANRLAPSCRFLAKSEERLWCGGLWDPSLIECSKIIVPGEPVQFTNDPSHQVVLAAPCTALAYMDGSVVAFTENEIYIISGDGPNDQGIGSFPPPRKMAHGVGCIDYRSVLETNIGTFFQSNRGIELLPRGFGPVQYVGKNVKDLVQSTGLDTCLGAAVHMGTKYHLARFLMGADNSGATSTIVYDLERGEWFRDTHQSSLAIGVWPDGVAYASATFDSDDFSYPFLHDNNAQSGDGGTNSYVASSITFARAFPFQGGHCGWGRFNKVMVACEGLGASQTMSLSVQTDVNTSQTPASTITITNSSALSWREMPIKSPGASSISITLSDSNATATTGIKYFGVAIDVDPAGGGSRLNASAHRG